EFAELALGHRAPALGRGRAGVEAVEQPLDLAQREARVLRYLDHAQELEHLRPVATAAARPLRHREKPLTLVVANRRGLDACHPGDLADRQGGLEGDSGHGLDLNLTSTPSVRPLQTKGVENDRGPHLRARRRGFGAPARALRPTGAGRRRDAARWPAADRPIRARLRRAYVGRADRRGAAVLPVLRFLVRRGRAPARGRRDRRGARPRARLDRRAIEAPTRS